MYILQTDDTCCDLFATIAAARNLNFVKIIFFLKLHGQRLAMEWQMEHNAKDVFRIIIRIVLCRQFFKES
jgi:hypothetical protein